MKMRNLLFLSLCLTGISMVKAQSPLSLVFSLTNGVEQYWDLSSIEKISFSGSDMLVSSKDGSIATLGLSAINKLYFSNITSVENNFVGQAESVSVVELTSEIIKISCPVGASIEIYQANGCKVMDTFSESEECVISISQFSKGVYIMKVANQITKFVKL